MAGIKGINSGLNIDDIVKATVAAQRAPKDAQLNRITTKAESQISALGTLRNALSEFQTALKGLNDASLYTARTVTSSDSARFTVTADTSALAGKYSIEIERLATSSKIATGSIKGDSNAVFEQGGTLTIGQADKSFDIDVAAGSSLKQVRDAINQRLKDEGITANIISDPGTGTSRLALSSSKTGDGQDLNFSVNASPSSDPQFNSLADLAGVTVLAAAGNAKLKVDGLEVQSASNTVDDVIEGVTLNLLKADSENDKALTLTVGDNTAAVKSNLQRFVDSYNKLITTTDSLTKMVAVSGGEPVVGQLLGDSSVRNLLNGLRSEMGTPGQGDQLRLLSDLGINTGKDGKLSLDSAKLDKALAENYDAVSGFLTGDQGVMGRLNARVEPYTATDGVLAGRVKGLEQTRANAKEEVTALNLRMEKVQARLYAQYNAMDSLVGQLSRTGDWMSSALSSLPGVVKKDR